MAASPASPPLPLLPSHHPWLSPPYSLPLVSGWTVEEQSRQSSPVEYQLTGRWSGRESSPVEHWLTGRWSDRESSPIEHWLTGQWSGIFQRSLFRE